MMRSTLKAKLSVAFFLALVLHSISHGDFRYTEIAGKETGPAVAIVAMSSCMEGAPRTAVEQLSTATIAKGRLILAAEFPSISIEQRESRQAVLSNEASDLKSFLSKTKPDYLILVAEDFDFHASIPNSLGNTIIQLNQGPAWNHIPALIQKKLNRETNQRAHQWGIQNPDSSGRFPLFGITNFDIPMILVTTTVKNERKEQPVSLRTRQIRQAVAIVLSNLDMVSNPADVVKLLLRRPNQNPAIAIYDGPGAISSSGHDPTWIRQSLEFLPFEIEMIGPMDIREGSLNQFDTVIFGGGSPRGQGESLRPVGRKAVKEFIRAGGGYVGICAGAFLAMSEKDYQLGLAELKTAGRSASSIIPLRFELDTFPVLIKDIPEVADTKLSGGPIFDSTSLPDNCKLWASFDKDVKYKGKVRPYKGKGAIIAGNYGTGLFVLFSPHCERFPGPQKAFWNALFWTSHNDRSAENKSESRITKIRNALQNPKDQMPVIVAHRGYHNVEPENSVPSILAAAEVGAHVVEIDVRKTSDNRYVLMHDATVKRTTYGKGKVQDYTLDDFKQLQLRNGVTPTPSHPPALEEAFEAARGRVLLNLDMKAVSIREMVDFARSKNILDHCLFKQWWDKLTADEIKWLSEKDDLLFMPLVRTPQEAKTIVETTPFRMMEVIYDSKTWKPEDLKNLQEQGVRIWANSLGAGPKGLDLGDRQAVYSPETVFPELVDMGVSIIQTDLPEKAIAVLGDFTNVVHN